MTLFAMLCSVPRKMARRISNQSIKHDDYRVEYPQEQEYKEFRPPSPAPSYTEKDVLPSMLRRLGELEDKVQVLETKPSEMPFEKEELLNAAVRRVDALEAELISTKKVSLFWSNLQFLHLCFQLAQTTELELAAVLQTMESIDSKKNGIYCVHEDIFFALFLN
jgi:hypothetical protein